MVSRTHSHMRTRGRGSGASLMRRLIATILAGTLVLPAQGNRPSIKEQALGISSGSTVEIRFAGKHRPRKVRGRIGAVDDNGFDLDAFGQGAELRHVAFPEVAWVQFVREPELVLDRAEDQFATGDGTMIPRGAVVEMTLTPKHKPGKFRGRLSAFGDRGLDLLVFDRGTIVTRHFDNADIRSVKRVRGLEMTSTAGKVHNGIGMAVALALTGAAVLIIVGLIVYLGGSH